MANRKKAPSPAPAAVNGSPAPPVPSSVRVEHLEMLAAQVMPAFLARDLSPERAASAALQCAAALIRQTRAHAKAEAEEEITGAEPDAEDAAVPAS